MGGVLFFGEKQTLLYMNSTLLIVVFFTALVLVSAALTIAWFIEKKSRK